MSVDPGLDAGLTTYLLAQASIVNLVGDRIYPSQAVEGATRPYIVQHRISERRFPSLAGPSGMVRARVQLDIFAASRDSANVVFRALRDKLDGFRNSTMGTENVMSVNLDDMRTELIAPTSGADPGAHRMITDWIVLYGETATSV